MNTHAELCTKTVNDIAALIKMRKVSPVEITKAMLERIETLDRRLHSYLTVASDLALQQAQRAEQEISEGNYRGPLHGVPIAVKDLIYTKDVRTTCASKILADWIPKYDARVIERLYDAGAVLLGKLTLTEFAGIGYHPSVPPAVNPWDSNRWTGSSSSGSGVATAASLCFASLGTDTGGSIRFPSAACGIVGLKPTYGKVSRHGVFPLAESLDHVGPLTHDVTDAAILLHATAGFDANDPTTRRQPIPDYLATLRQGVKDLRVGVDWSYCSTRVDPDTKQSIVRGARVLGELEVEIKEVSLTGVEEASGAWGVIFTAECGASHEQTYPSRAEDFSAPFRAFLEEAQKVRGIDYAKAYAARQRVARMIDDALQQVDVLLCPTMGMVPMNLEGRAPDEIITPEVGHTLLSFTSPFSLSGNPTISIPSGFNSDGLPVSMTLVGKHDEEALILRAAYAFEQASEWHTRRPRLVMENSK
jgi:amidase